MAAMLGISDNYTVFSDIPCAAVMFRTDEDTVKIVWANERFFRLFGCTKEEYFNISVNENGFRFLEREYSAYIIDKAEAIMKNCDNFTIEVDARDISGSHLPLYAEISVADDGDNRVFSCLLHKVSDMGGVLRSNSDMSNMMHALMSISADYIFRYTENNDNLCIFKNVGGSFANKEEINDFELYFKNEGIVFEEDEKTFEQFATNIKSGIDKGIFEMRLKFRNDSDFKWYRVSVKTIRDKTTNGYIGSVGKIEDISSLKNANQRLIEKAERDPLTKLYNKAATKSLIQNYLRTDSRDTYDAFIIVDVDNFKQLNDNLGHIFGDSVLVELGQELQDLFRTNDVIGRIGGDEFIVFLRGLKQKSHIASKADDICKVFKLIYPEDDGLGFSGSLGIALFPDDGDSFDELYRKADTALYKSKRAGKSCYTFYKSGEIMKQEEKPVPRIERYQNNMDFLSSVSGFNDTMMSDAFELSENGSGINDAINALITKTAKTFNLSRVVVSECIEDGKIFRDSYSCSSKNAEIPRSNTIKFSAKELNDMCSCFDKNFIFDVSVQNSEKLKDNAYITYLKANKVQSAATCGYFRSGHLVGMISFQEYAGGYVLSIEEANALKDLTRVIFSFLMRLRDYEEAREKASFSANYDALTGLMNFESFKKSASEYMSSAFDDDRLVFLMADFSNFSYVNSKFGYETGNKVLKSFANAFVYFSDNIKLVCRVNADKFCALAEYDENIISSYEAFTRRFSTNEMLAGGATNFGIMTGAYICGGNDAADFDATFDNVNLALKYSKSHIIGRCSIYKPEMREDLNRTIEIAVEAKKALINHEFKVFFQPKYSITKNEVVGAEALIRWIKPNGTIIPPNNFVPLLEKNGYIVNIDYFVYEEVCKFIRERIDKGLNLVPVSVNVSRIHMLTNDFVKKVTDIVKHYRVPTKLIELELTESVFLANEDEAVRIFAKLRELGFVISIDDFGSGYSSLSLLKKMPVDVLKIDKGFFTDGTVGDRDGILLSSVIDMADKMDISIICEGVETEEQVDFLKGSKCDTAQGFYFAKPIDVNAFDELLGNIRKQ